MNDPDKLQNEHALSASAQEQILEQLKLLLPAIGGLLTMMGLLTPAESAKWITTIMNAAGPMMILGGMIWGVLDKRQKSLVAKVDALAKDQNSPVIGVIVSPTVAGKELANSLPGNTTVPAGTVQASELAANSHDPR